MATCEINEQTSRLENWSFDPMFTLPLENPEILQLEEYASADLSDFIWEDGVIHYDQEPERARQIRIGELRFNLKETDEKITPMLEGLFDALDEVEPFDLLSLLRSFKKLIAWRVQAAAKWGHCIEQRKAWRKELEELEPKNA